MFNLALIRKSINEARWLFLGCAAGLFSFCWARVWLVSRLETSRFQQILELIPKEWEKFSSVPFEQLISHTGRIALTFNEPLVVLAVTVWAIARGSDAVAGELGRGTMEMLLSQPISRIQSLGTHCCVTLLGLALLCGTAWGGIAVGIQTTQAKLVAPGQDITLRIPLMPEIKIPINQGERRTLWVPMREMTHAVHFWPGVLNLFSLGFFLTGASVALSSCDRYRWRTIGIVSAFYVVESLLWIIGKAVGEFSWLLYFTFFTVYEPERYINISVHQPNVASAFILLGENGEWIGLGPLGCDSVLLVLGTACFAFGAAAFLRRDIPAPI